MKGIPADYRPDAPPHVIGHAYRIIQAGRPWWDPLAPGVSGVRIGKAIVTRYDGWPALFITLGRRRYYTAHAGIMDATRRMTHRINA